MLHRGAISEQMDWSLLFVVGKIKTQQDHISRNLHQKRLLRWVWTCEGFVTFSGS